MTVRPAAGDNAVADERARVVVAFDDHRLMPALFGEFDQNLAMIEQRLAATDAGPVLETHTK